jgi:two-component system, sensor histidine kinase PdtaS
LRTKKHEYQHPPFRHCHPGRDALRITAVYLALGTLWILFSDSLVGSIASGPADVAQLQSIKGVVFVALTALVIYLLLHRSFHRLHETRRRAQDLKNALDEKNALLREVHHRVKNNLAVMTGLVRLQLHESSAGQGSASALSKTRDRMEVMSLIHHMLYQEQNLSRIEFGGVLTRVVNQLFDHYATRQSVHLDLDLQEAELEIGTALPLGLIANEAVTNALTHAFPAQEGEKRLLVRLRAHTRSPGDGSPGDGGYVLTVEDNGVGLGEGFDAQQQDSLGFRMMLVLAQQIQARLTVTPGDAGGTTVAVTLPG